MTAPIDHAPLARCAAAPPPRNLELPLGFDAEPPRSCGTGGKNPGSGRGGGEAVAQRILRLFGPAPLVRDAHPSAETLEAVRALRDLHFANGHTPAHDAREHGPSFFTTAAREFLQRADHARTPEKARRRRIAAIAMLVAMLDREDFMASQNQPASSSRKAAGQPETEDAPDAAA